MKPVTAVASLFGVLVAASVLAVIMAALTTSPATGYGWADALAHWIPSAEHIAGYTSDPARARLIYGAQWLAFPVYLVLWFGGATPWSAHMRAAAAKKAATLSRAQRLVFVLAMLCLCIYLLGDFGVLSCPTFYRGQWAYPPQRAVLGIGLIYRSWTALGIYGAIATWCEACVWWVFVFFACNVRTYLRGTPAPA